MAVLSGLPLIVERFVKRIAYIENLSIFAVCTCGGYECVNALQPLYKLRKSIEACGGRLSSEYSVRLPMNNLDYDHIPIPIIRDQAVILNKSKIKINDICNRILQGNGTSHKTIKKIFTLLMIPLFKSMHKPVLNALKEKAKLPIDCGLDYSELIPLTDRSITVDDRYTGCGTCAKVCPVKNIKLVGKRPEFQHRCEMCFACDEWCPSSAIHHWSRAEGVKYRQPEVELSDML